LTQKAPNGHTSQTGTERELGPIEGVACKGLCIGGAQPRGRMFGRGDGCGAGGTEGALVAVCSTAVVSSHPIKTRTKTTGKKTNRLSSFASTFFDLLKFRAAFCRAAVGLFEAL
jgi:hypothetical protein